MHGTEQLLEGHYRFRHLWVLWLLLYLSSSRSVRRHETKKTSVPLI